MKPAVRRGWNAWWVRYYTLRLAHFYAKAAERAAQQAELDAMSARLAPKAAPVTNIVAPPVGKFVQQCKPKLAYGTTKPRNSGGFKGASSTANIAKAGERRALTGYAARGW